MKISVVAVITLIALAIAAGGGYWFGQQRGGASPKSAPGGGAAPAAADKGPGGAPTAILVEAITAATASMPQTITAVGSLRSDESVTVRPEVAGRVTFIGFQEGQPVAKGSMLVKLDPAINAAEVQQAKANVTLAKAKYERAVDLQKQGFISGQARDEAENNLKVADAAAALAAARIAKTEIRAPFSGIIGLRSVSLGDYVKEGQDMVNLESIDPLKVDFRVPEVYLKQVQVGQTLQVTLDALPGRTYDGKVFAINPLVDAAGRAIVVRAQVRNADTAMRPGMFARVRLLTKQDVDALVLPEQALVPQGEDQYVFRVVDGKAVRTKVEVGQRRDGRVEVVRGIAPGDTIVIAGQIKIRDGTTVTTLAADKPAGKVAAPSPALRGPTPAKADGAVPPPAPKS
ncbi:MAG: efflux RND transporter periplasmic adaptor subunit [Betaproteobacteria bacterium]